MTLQKFKTEFSGDFHNFINNEFVPPGSNEYLDTENPFTGKKLKNDIGKAHDGASRINAGTVWVNCHNIFDASLPFGGYKESGWGREMGHEVLKNYTEVKAVTVNL